MSSRSLPKYKAAEFRTSWNTVDVKGRGGFACVRKCEHSDLGKVVVKCFQITGTKENENRTMQEIEREVNVLSRLLHKNIVRIHGTTQWAHSIGIIMECIEGGNLEDLLLSRTIPDIPWLLRLRFHQELADGLAYLHNYDQTKAFVHGDLKPQNILLTLDLTVKIADFGSVSIAMKSGASASLEVRPTTQHTLYYTAPELLKNSQMNRSSSMDVYSGAMIGYEILTRQPVFQGGINPNIIVQTIIDRGQKPDDKLLNDVEASLKDKPQDLCIFKFLKEINMKCWEFKAEDRPDIRSVRNQINKKLIELAASHLTYTMNDLIVSDEANDKPAVSVKIKLNELQYPFQEGAIPSSPPSGSSRQIVPRTKQFPKTSAQQSEKKTVSHVEKPKDKLLLQKREASTGQRKQKVQAEQMSPSSLEPRKGKKKSFEGKRKTADDQQHIGLSDIHLQQEDINQQLQRFLNKGFGWEEGDGHELLSWWVKLYEFNDSFMSMKAAECFPTQLKLTEIRLNEDHILAISNVLKYTNKVIDWIDLRDCQLCTSSFQKLSSALLESESTIRILYINKNELDSVENVLEMMPKINDELWLEEAFIDDHGGWRNANDCEQQQIQEVLNKHGTSLKVRLDASTTLQFQSKTCIIA